MSIAKQLEEAVATVPWDLHEAYGVSAGYYRRRSEPKYTGLVGSRHEAALKKGYVDLGLVSPEVAKELPNGALFLQTIARHVGHILMTNDVAFIRDPEDIMGVKGYDSARLGPLVKQVIAGEFDEERSYASERDDPDSEISLAKTSQGVMQASIGIQPVKGTTGAGFKITLRPSVAEIEKKVKASR